MSALLLIDQLPSPGEESPWVIEGGRAMRGHESGRRIAELRSGLERHGGVHALDADASDDDLARTLSVLHRPEYLAALRGVRSEEPVMMPELAPPGLSPDMAVCTGLVAAAHEGVRTAITAARKLAEGERFTYALCRPPGHHAGPGWLAGYCYLNNAAAAVHTLLYGADHDQRHHDQRHHDQRHHDQHRHDQHRHDQRHHEHDHHHDDADAHNLAPADGGIGTVGVLDLDIHYPNGTSAILAPLERARLHSLHAWPVTNVASRTATPTGDRERVVEFDEPPEAELYLEFVAASIAELAQSCDALVLSLGYDMIAGDPHGSWNFAPSIFADIGWLLAKSGLPICVIQEGGYALEQLADCASAFAAGLLTSDDAPSLDVPPPDASSPNPPTSSAPRLGAPSTDASPPDLSSPGLEASPQPTLAGDRA
jgi:acetoin utilization deacetylase AcuC-like enzyme